MTAKPPFGTAGNHSHDAARAAFYAVNRLPSLGDDTRPEALTEAAAHRLLNNLTPRPAVHLDAVMAAYPIGLGMDFGEWRRRALNRTHEVEAQRNWGAIITRLPSAAGGLLDRTYIVTLMQAGHQSYQVDIDRAGFTVHACGSGRRITAPATLGHLAELIDAANGQGKLDRHTVGMDTLAAIGAEIAAADGKTQTASEEARKAQALRDAAPDLLAALEEALRCLSWHEQQHGVGMDRAACEAARAALAAANGAAHPLAYRVGPKGERMAGGTVVHAPTPASAANTLGVTVDDVQRLDAGVWVWVV